MWKIVVYINKKTEEGKKTDYVNNTTRKVMNEQVDGKKYREEYVDSYYFSNKLSLPT